MTEDQDPSLGLDSDPADRASEAVAGMDASVSETVHVYQAQTERLKALDEFVTVYGPWTSATPLLDGSEAIGALDAIRAARELAVCSAFEAIRRIADGS